jgi:large subunit ribosomal protein L24
MEEKKGNKRLRPGEEVVVIAGNDKGKSGKILSCDGDRIRVEGVNVRKKHMKRTQQNQKGQIIDIECPIHVSNVKPYVDGKGVKLRARFNKEGERELYYLDGKKAVIHRPVKKPKS